MKGLVNQCWQGLFLVLHRDGSSTDIGITAVLVVRLLQYSSEITPVLH